MDGTSNTIMAAETDSANFTGSQFPGQGRRRVAGERVFRTTLLATQTWHWGAMAAGVQQPPVPNRVILWPDGQTPTSQDWWRAGPYALAPVYYTQYGPNSEWPGPGSFHEGGLQVLMADGSVRFVSENISHDGNWTLSVWQALHSVDGSNAQVSVSNF